MFVEGIKYGSKWEYMPREVDEVLSVMCKVSLVIKPSTNHSLMCERGDVGRFKSSIESNYVFKDKELRYN